MNRWNPDIDRRGNTFKIKVGKRIVVLNGVQEVERKENPSRMFRREIESKEIGDFCSMYMAFGSKETNLFGASAFSGE